MQTIRLPDVPVEPGSTCELTYTLSEPGTLQGLELAVGLVLEQVHVGTEEHKAVGWQGARVVAGTAFRAVVRNSTDAPILAWGVLAFAPVPREVLEESTPPLQIPQVRIPVGIPQGQGAPPLVVEAVMVQEQHGLVQGLAAPPQTPSHSHVLGRAEGPRPSTEMALAPTPVLGLEPHETGVGIVQGYADAPRAPSAEAQTLREAVIVRPGVNEMVVLLTRHDLIRILKILRGQDNPTLNPGAYGDIAIKLDGALRS